MIAYETTLMRIIPYFARQVTQVQSAFPQAPSHILSVSFDTGIWRFVQSRRVSIKQRKEGEGDGEGGRGKGWMREWVGR